MKLLNNIQEALLDAIAWIIRQLLVGIIGIWYLVLIILSPIWLLPYYLSNRRSK